MLILFPQRESAQPRGLLLEHKDRALFVFVFVFICSLEVVSLGTL